MATGRERAKMSGRLLIAAISRTTCVETREYGGAGRGVREAIEGCLVGANRILNTVMVRAVRDLRASSVKILMLLPLLKDLRTPE